VSDTAGIDLHTHSTCSDGVLDPEELVARAAAAGVRILALTDHDSVAGLAAAATAARQYGVRLITGVELSATWRHQVIHVLGFDFDPSNAILRDALAAQADRRRARMAKICARLSQCGLPGEELLAAVSAERGLPSRSHLARHMVALGLARSIDDAFGKYLRRGKTAALAADWPPLAEVIGWTRTAGGFASLAHPARYALSAGARRQLVADFATAGGAALEVVTGGNAPQHIETCADLALRHELAGSAGSDFHDPKFAWNPLGRLAKLPDRVRPLWGAFKPGMMAA
jgi:3',5'-nucleoside bisphosphate phosphatase